MQKIQFFKNINGQPCALAGEKGYRGYTISNLPKSFGFIYDEIKDQEGITEWFNYKGLTYICE